MASIYVLAKTWKETHVNTDYVQYEDHDIYFMIKNSYETKPRLDAYGHNSYSRMSNNTLKLEEPQPLYIVNSKPLAIKYP